MSLEALKPRQITLYQLNTDNNIKTHKANDDDEIRPQKYIWLFIILMNANCMRACPLIVQLLW